MPRSCIFCDNDAGSPEHFWPAWVHAFIRQNHIDLGGLRVQRGSEPETIQYDIEMTIDTVCGKCNNTWMSQIEQKNRPRFLKMLKNEPLTLDVGGMKVITEWVVLKSMLQDSDRHSRDDEKFYTRAECVAMYERREIPARTRVWMGALDGFHIGGHGTDFTICADGGKTRIGTGCANTIYMGYFVAQVVAEHFHPNVPADQIPPIQPPAGISDKRLIQIYPPGTKKADWSPAPFTNGGPNGIAYLMQRWRQGEKVSLIKRIEVVK